jgi:hypothetical protein
VTVVEEAKYSGSYAARAGNDLRDVEARIDKASQAFGALKHCLFKHKDGSIFLITASPQPRRSASEISFGPIFRDYI